MDSVISSIEVASTGGTQLVEKNVYNPADAIPVDPSLSVVEAGVATVLEQPFVEVAAQPEGKGEIGEVDEPVLPEEVEKQSGKSFPSGHIESVEDDIPKAA